MPLVSAKCATIWTEMWANVHKMSWIAKSIRLVKTKKITNDWFRFPAHSIHWCVCACVNVQMVIWQSILCLAFCHHTPLSMFYVNDFMFVYSVGHLGVVAKKSYAQTPFRLCLCLIIIAQHNVSQLRELLFFLPLVRNVFDFFSSENSNKKLHM